ALRHFCATFPRRVLYSNWVDMERRLTAILAADVVGYSRLMTIDEAGTLATLKSLRKNLVDPKISEHNGRIFKLTDNGMLIEFPSVVSAVACASDIQSAI